MFTLLSGFALSVSLIMAIGAQNAFVLRQGLRQEHVFAVCALCAFSDAVLITAGVTGMGAMVARLTWLEMTVRWGGAAFLLWYGARNFWSAWTGGAALKAAAGETRPLLPTLLTALALTWLNPHVYLDTVLLLGSISARYDNTLAFGIGAALGSAVFFFSLGYGARVLAPLFARPKAWQVLDVLIGITMWAIAASLVLERG
ncbi:LysE/ArgO family amino acid transporter [Pseudoprimorskyibacter insulae]|uniref:Arginine exporter protein ArgO n=1 Tax=Pseudoprimorskyibacter insulae TaxID=1695997 RepID=A0A2R8AR46_9RHOB|nr:LysE/ArgO family amino acid transporter [Pseudoprimorskyibacter insulae]SPF78314.1 Arginine exporter protein ArgO [Pseudoprimorskyibacter insulae]